MLAARSESGETSPPVKGFRGGREHFHNDRGIQQHIASLVMELQVALIGFQGPEELAPILLRLARSHMQGGAFLPEQVTQHTMREGLAIYGQW